MSTTTPEPLCCTQPQPDCTDCGAPHCLAVHCTSCDTGCDLHVPGGTCETVLAWLATFSDQQAAAISDLLGPEARLRLLNVAWPGWFAELQEIAHQLEDIRDQLARPAA